MENYQRKAAIIAGIFLVVQILTFLFWDINSITFLFSITASVLYLVYTGDIHPEEAVAGTAGFIISSFALSSLGKIFFLDSLCETARSSAEAGALSQTLNPEHICQGFFEAWIRALTTDPVYNWYFWVGAFGVAVLSGYSLRRYTV
jgi:hypothetical protein